MLTTASPELRAAVTIGLLGAFTTFSTFTYETVPLLEHGERSEAGAYSGGGVIEGLEAED